ncbi:MAG: type II toxin-antitoxin system RelE family toxin [Acidithiobacillus sp.]
MTYKLAFHPAALKEWQGLDSSVRAQFKKKLAERLENPLVPSAQLRGYTQRYKIKLHTVGYRLVYQVLETEVTVLVVAVGKRDRSAVYHKSQER